MPEKPQAERRRHDSLTEKLQYRSLRTVYTETVGGESRLVLVFYDEISHKTIEVTVGETGGIGGDSNWYTFPVVLIDGEKVWHG